MKKWTAEKVTAIGIAFQPACVLMAGAELGVFDALADTAPDGGARWRSVSRRTLGR